MPSQAPIKLKATHIIESAAAAGVSVAGTVGDLSGVPYLSPIADALGKLNERYQGVKKNRKKAGRLVQQCAYLAQSVHEKAGPSPAQTDDLDKAVGQLQDLIHATTQRMVSWARIGTLSAFFQSGQMEDEIEECTLEIKSCWDQLQLTMQRHIMESQERLARQARENHDETTDRLLSIELVTTELKQQASDTMSLLQQRARAEDCSIPQRTAIFKKLYKLQLHAHQLLPDLHLVKDVEVEQVGSDAVSGTDLYDIFEGRYLGEEKVHIQKLRLYKSNDANRDRFDREIEVWRRVYDADQGEHILPFYGTLWRDPMVGIVYPLMPNGNARKYVREHDESTNHLKLIQGVAKGIEVLHGLNISHRDIRGENILIDAQGKPLIAGFGLAKLIETDGAEMSLSVFSGRGRWFAPELLSGDSDEKFSFPVDIWAFAMTILELLTHRRPYEPECKREQAAIDKIRCRKLPEPPRDSDTIRRGLDVDGPLWQLLLDCWKFDSSKRPTIGEVATRLITIRQAAGTSR